MKNLKNKAIITLLLVCMLVSVLLTGCSKKALTPEEISENLVIQYQSDVDYYPEGYAVMYSNDNNFDEKLETIPTEGSYSFDGKEYVLTHDTEKRLKKREKGYFTLYRGKSEDGQTLEIEIAEVCDYPTRLILGCDCSEHFEYVNRVEIDECEIREHEVENHDEAKLQKMLDKVNAEIDLSEYHYVDRKYGATKATEFVLFHSDANFSLLDKQWITVFYCKNCEKLVGYQIDGVIRLDELPDVPCTTDRAVETAIATVVDDYNENVYHKYPLKTAEEKIGYRQITSDISYKSDRTSSILYSAEFDRYYISLETEYHCEQVKYERKEDGLHTYTDRFPAFYVYTALLLEPKRNTGVIIAVAVVSVIILASILFFFAKKKKGKISEIDEETEEAQQN